MITEVEGNKKKPFCALTIIGDCLLALNNFSSAIGNGERWTITTIKLCKNLNSQTVNINLNIAFLILKSCFTSFNHLFSIQALIEGKLEFPFSFCSKEIQVFTKCSTFYPKKWTKRGLVRRSLREEKNVAKTFLSFWSFLRRGEQKGMYFPKRRMYFQKKELCYKIFEREEECSEISKNDNDNDYYYNTLVRRSSRKRKNLAKFPMAKLWCFACEENDILQNFLWTALKTQGVHLSKSSTKSFTLTLKLRDE